MKIFEFYTTPDLTSCVKHHEAMLTDKTYTYIEDGEQKTIEVNKFYRIVGTKHQMFAKSNETGYYDKLLKEHLNTQKTNTRIYEYTFKDGVIETEIHDAQIIRGGYRINTPTGTLTIMKEDLWKLREGTPYQRYTPIEDMMGYLSLLLVEVNAQLTILEDKKTEQLQRLGKVRKKVRELKDKTSTPVYRMRIKPPKIGARENPKKQGVTFTLDIEKETFAATCTDTGSLCLVDKKGDISFLNPLDLETFLEKSTVMYTTDPNEERVFTLFKELLEGEILETRK